MIGWLVAWKCLVACLFFESSQQPTCPHSRQRRRWTQVSPILKQSSQPLALGVTCRMWSRCVHLFAMCSSFLMRASDSGQLSDFLLEMPATTFSGPNACTLGTYDSSDIRLCMYTCILSLPWGRCSMTRQVLTSHSAKDTIA